MRTKTGLFRAVPLLSALPPLRIDDDLVEQLCNSSEKRRRGWLPQYANAKRIENELREARQENSLAQLRDLVSLAYFQASQKNYGLAADTSSRFFNRTREVANQTPDSAGRKPLEDLLSFRDRITTELAKGDPAVLERFADLVDEDSPGHRRRTANGMIPDENAG